MNKIHKALGSVVLAGALASTSTVAFAADATTSTTTVVKDPAKAAANAAYKEALAKWKAEVAAIQATAKAAAADYKAKVDANKAARARSEEHTSELQSH